MSVLGMAVLSPSANSNKYRRDSNAATANRIPKKKRILGSSIFDKDLCTGLWWAAASLSASMDVILIFAAE